MTHAATLAPTTHATPEAARDAAYGKYSLTSVERCAAAVDLYKAAVWYELQGGRDTLAWVKHAGFSRGTAVNLLNAGRAQMAGHTSSTNSVTELASIGALMKAGKNPQEIAATLARTSARKAAAEQAGIGLNGVTFPADSTEEVAGVYVALKDAYRASNLTTPDLPELTLTLVRLAARQVTPENVARLEGAHDPNAPTPAPTSRHPDPLPFYAWVRERHPRCEVPNCGAAGEQLHHVHTHLGRKQHHLRVYPVLHLCARHHQTGGHAAAHNGERAWMEREFGGRDVVLELLWERAAEYAEHLKGGA